LNHFELETSNNCFKKMQSEFAWQCSITRKSNWRKKYVINISLLGMSYHTHIQTVLL